MRLGTVVATAWKTFTGRPTDLVPLYVLGMALAGLLQVGMLIGFVLIVGYLSLTGRLAKIQRNLDGLGQPPNPELAPEAFSAWTERLAAALEPAMTLPVGVLVAVTGLVTVTVLVLATAAVSAGQLAGCLGRLRDERGLVAGLTGARRFWPSILALYLLELIAWIAISLLAGLLAITGSAGVFVGVAGWFVAAVVIRAVFAFAPVAVVVDETTAIRAMRYAASYVRHRPVEAGFYYILVIAVFIGFGIVSSLLGVLGVAAGTGLVLSLLIVPVLDLVKTTLYAGGRGAVDPPSPVDRTLGSRLRKGLGRSWRELIVFVRATPGPHALAAGMLVGGIVAGWLLAAPLEGIVESSIAGRLIGHSALVATAEFFGNNWTVALTMAFGGLFAVIPALVQLAFNGVTIGAISRTEVDLVELLAFMAPHGVFELPAIVVAGAVGIFLGTNWWQTWRGRGSRADLADALERAIWVLLGVGILLAIAAAIEGFVSPYYWRPFL